MNERIQELLAQAYKEASVPGPIEDKVTVQEKFAELIVRECADIIGKVPNGYRDYRNQIEDAMRNDCIQAIQEHFGVES